MKRRRWPRVGALVLVRWDDASFAQRDDDDDDYIVETVGWLIRRTSRSIRIAGERLPGGSSERWRGVTRIPIGMVRDVVRIA